MVVGNPIILDDKQLGQTVLENLNDKKTSLTLQPLLTTALQNKLSGYFTTNPNLQKMVGTLQNIDFVSNAKTTIQNFLKKNMGDSIKNSKVKKEFTDIISKIPSNLTIGNVLQLNSSTDTNPIFQDITKYSNAAALLKTSSIPSKLVNTVITIYQKYNYVPSDAFWNELGQNAALKSSIDDLKFTILLGNLIGNNSLIGQIQAQKKSGSVQVSQDLVTIDWKQIISTGVQKGTITIPPDITGDTPDAKIQNYANKISQTVRTAFPTAAFFQDFTTDPVRVAKNPNPKPSPSLAKFYTVYNDLYTLFKNNKNVDLASINVWNYLKDSSNNAFGTIAQANRPAFTSILLLTQRLHRLTQNYNHVITLLNLGFESAHDIARIPKYNFLRNNSASFSQDDAEKIHDAATHIAARSLHIFANHSKLVNNLSVASIANSTVNFGSNSK